jgi:hypothetical protein
METRLDFESYSEGSYWLRFEGMDLIGGKERVTLKYRDRYSMV